MYYSSIHGNVSIIKLGNAHPRFTDTICATIRGIVFFLAVSWALAVAASLTDNMLDFDVECVQSVSFSAGTDGGSLAL